MNNDVSIKEIRDTLGSYQIPKNQIEKKGGFDYLKWSYALGVFLQHYPDARWEFTQWEQADGTMVDVQYYKDGSCSVECRVFVGNVSQYMWLQVNDFKNIMLRLKEILELSDKQHAKILQRKKNQKPWETLIVSENLSWEHFSKLNLTNLES